MLRSKFKIQSSVKKVSLENEDEDEVQGSKEHTANDDSEIVVFEESPSEKPTETVLDIELPIQSSDIEPTQSLNQSPVQSNDEGQLASSYLQEEAVSLVEQFKSTKFSVDKSLFFQPNGKEIVNLRLRHILNEYKEPDDGIYIDSQISFDNTDMIKLINRCTEEMDDELFVDGEHKRNFQNFSIDNHLYKSVSMHKFETKEFYCPLNQLYEPQNTASPESTLKLYLDKIVLIDNEIKTSREMITKIERLYNEFKRYKEQQTIKKLEIELQVLRELIKNFVVPDDDIDNKGGSLKLYKNALKSIRARFYKEMALLRSVLQSLLETWLAYKTSTDKNNRLIRLVIKVTETNTEKDQENWDRQFTQDLNEIYIEALEEFEEINSADKLTGRTNETGSLPDNLGKPDINVLQTDLLKLYWKAFRQPGEPLIDIELTWNDEYVHSKEITCMKSTNIFLKIVIDSKQIGKIQLPPSSSYDGSISIKEGYKFQITDTIPKEVVLQLLREGKYNSMNLLSEIAIPIPCEDVEFSKSPVMNFDFNPSGNHGIAANIYLKVGWEIALGSTRTIHSSVIAYHGNRSNIKISPELIDEWVSNGQIDPMDPETSSLLRSYFDKVNEKITTDITHNEDLSFYFKEDELNFCTDAELNSDKRLKLLKARSDNDLRYKDCRFIPSTEREVELADDTFHITELDWMTKIDSQRLNGRNYLRKIYDLIEYHCSILENDCNPTDLLDQNSIPTIESIISSVIGLFIRHRPLNPTRREDLRTIKVPFKSDNVQNIKIYLNVIRGYGIPVRINENPSVRRSSVISISKTSIKNLNVRPFIIAKYKNITVRTTTSDGSNPTWNEQLILPITGRLCKLKGAISIQIFDEIIEDIIEDDVLRTGELFQRISTRLLGEFRIPFTTIFSSQKIDGIFEIPIPPVLFGYTKSSLGTPQELAYMGGNVPDMKERMYLSLFVACEPIFDIPKINPSYLECTELTKVKDRIQLWSLNYRDEFPHRFINPLVVMSSGKRICTTRLLCPLDPPFQRNETTEIFIRRYVANIPVYTKVNACTALSGVWLTNEEILNITLVSPKDLGVLLCCYYLAIGYRAWLVAGKSLLIGETTFVLILEDGEYYFIDPSTGRKYSTKDLFCPLTEIYYLVNEENVWGNIQKETRPFLTNVDIKQSSEWRPLFNTTLQSINSGIHNLNYQYDVPFSTNELQKIIELKIIKKISSWRMNHKTVWNRNIRQQLQDILVELEEDACLDITTKHYVEKLHNVSATFKVSGFPFNVPYTNLTTLIEKIRSLGVHQNTNPNCEFSLAVYVASYPNAVLSIWICLISLVPKVH